MRYIFAAGLAILLAGCAANKPPHFPPAGQSQAPGQRTPEPAPSPQRPEPAHEPASKPQPPPPRTIDQTASPAVMSLVHAADQAVKQNRPGVAGTRLERALGLDPRNPFLYQRLAGVRLIQNQPAQAIQIARKSNSLAGHNPYVKRDNWRLIAQALEMQHKSPAAERARNKAQDYQSATRQYQQ